MFKSLTVLYRYVCFITDILIDMVAMFHNISGKYSNGTVFTEQHHTSRLVAFGTPGGDSAMAATVGYTTAAAAELMILDNSQSSIERTEWGDHSYGQTNL
jgi:hypothetical protein